MYLALTEIFEPYWYSNQEELTKLRHLCQWYIHTSILESNEEPTTTEDASELTRKGKGQRFDSKIKASDIVKEQAR